MLASYFINDVSEIYSPALLFYPELIQQNIARAVVIAGSPARLRPHVKTHKTREIVRLELDAGITRHKCATISEAEMLADAGAPDVLVAYHLVGPNCIRIAQLAAAYPACCFSTLADHPDAVRALSQALAAAEQSVEVLLDLDVGQQRTGIPPGPAALALYELFDGLPGLQPGGLHAYDGHNHQTNLAERQAAVHRQLEQVLALRDLLESKGLPVPRLVLGGTPTFPLYAQLQVPGLECAPGTCILQDYNYSRRFPDLTGFTPAALLLTRVISRPSAARITLDLGTKAVASDPPPGQRCLLLNVPECQTLLHNEEHLVVETPAAERFRPGDAVYALPAHVCPTCALYRHAHVVSQGRVTDRWEIAARDRVLRF